MLIVDTGPLVAAADRDDRNHAACRRELLDASSPLITTGLVIAEAAFLIAGQDRDHVGERTRAVNWGLDVPLPGDLHAAFERGLRADPNDC